MHFSGCGVTTFTACLHVVKEAAENGFAADFRPSLETGTVFDAVLSVNYCAIAIRVSVIAVQEKCDEKGRGVRLGKPMRETAVESHPFRKVREKDGATRLLIVSGGNVSPGCCRENDRSCAPLFGRSAWNPRSRKA